MSELSRVEARARSVDCWVILFSRAVGYLVLLSQAEPRHPLPGDSPLIDASILGDAGDPTHGATKVLYCWTTSQASKKGSC